MRSVTKWIIILVCSMAIGGIGYLFFLVRELDKEEDYLCDRGFGLTPIRLKVLDQGHQHPVDSVRLIIKAGASAERVVDTLIKQEGGISYDIFIPEYANCESYWFEVSHKLYWDDFYFMDTTRNAGIKKGAINESTVYLKPATKIEFVLRNELKEFNGDTAFVLLGKQGEEVRVWDYFTESDFQEKENITEFYSLESGAYYRVTWIQKNNQSVDTTHHEFYTRPFDTLNLNFVFENPAHTMSVAKKIQNSSSPCHGHIDTLTHMEVHYFVGKMPVMDGEMTDLLRDIWKYPTAPLTSVVNTKVIVAFIIDKNGKVTGERIIRDIEGTSYGSNVLKAVRNRQWTPGTCNGKPVATIQLLPVIIELQ